MVASLNHFRESAPFSFQKTLRQLEIFPLHEKFWNGSTNNLQTSSLQWLHKQLSGDLGSFQSVKSGFQKIPPYNSLCEVSLIPVFYQETLNILKMRKLGWNQKDMRINLFLPFHFFLWKLGC